MRRTPQRLIALVAVFAAGLVVTLVPGTTRARADNVCTPDSSWGTVNSSFASQVLTLVNQHRAAIGVGQLTTDGALQASAVWKSMNMAGLNYFDHNDDPIGRTVQDRLTACGWPANQGWGENIAYGFQTPADVMNAWLNSAGHKANIENPSYTSIGIGVAANAQGVYYWTQDFGQGSSGGGPPPPATTAPAPVTTSPPATTPPPPATTQQMTTQATTTTSNSTTVVEPPKPARADAAVPKVRKTHKAHKANATLRWRAYVIAAPPGHLDLRALHHL